METVFSTRTSKTLFWPKLFDGRVTIGWEDWGGGDAASSDGSGVGWGRAGGQNGDGWGLGDIPVYPRADGEGMGFVGYGDGDGISY